MNITIPDELMQSSDLTVVDVKRELGLLFVQQKMMSTQQAAQLADMHWVKFEQLVVQRGISAPLRFEKLSRLQERDCIVGDADDLVNMSWEEEWSS